MAVTIYIITNKINGKLYIGQAKNFKKRMQGHIRRSKTHDTELYRSIRKHGWANFEMKPLCIVEDFMADETEIKCIASYDTMVPNGYNLTAGGVGTKNYTYTEEHKRKISERMKTFKHTPAGLENCRIAAQKRAQDPSFGEKIRERMLGRRMPEDTKIKLSKSLKDKGISPSAVAREMAKKVNYVSVKCVDTGETYESVTAAAEAIGMHPSTISSAIRRGGKVKGMVFVKVGRLNE